MPSDFETQWTTRKKRSKSHAASLKEQRIIARMKEAGIKVGDTFALKHPWGTDIVTIVPSKKDLRTVPEPTAGKRPR